MSRTYRKRGQHKDEDFLNLLILLISEIEKNNEVYFISDDGTFYVRFINQKIELLKNETDGIKKVKLFLKEEIYKEKRYIKKLYADKSNWRGAAIRLTKEYSHMKSRSGKNKVINTIIKNIDLKNIVDFDDVEYFAEPNLGSIKGAIWKFD